MNVYGSSMDSVAGLLDGPRARGAFLLRSVMEPPWSVRVQDEAPLSLVAMVRGEAWFTASSADPTRLSAGDVAILRGPAPYTLGDRPETQPQVIIHPGQRCTDPAGYDVAGSMAQGVRTWGNHVDGSTSMLVGTYEHVGEVGQRLLRTLPPLLVAGADDLDAALLELLTSEVGRDRPGQDVVLDRMLDLLVITVLRTWFAQDDADPPGWYLADADEVVGPALRLIHNDPARPWTVAGLAAEVGVSRAAFARRFTDLIGEPPMTYLTGWRLTLAADLLLEPGATIGAVARRVGYGTAFALSAAFKRVRGVSPRQHRLDAVS